MTKERLRDYRAIVHEIETLEHQIETIETALYHPKVPKLRNTPKAAGSGRTTEDLAAKHQVLLELYRGKLGRMAEELLAIEQAIDRLPARERTILRRYYLEGMTWEEVCVAEHYSWRQVHRIHARALERLREEE